MTARNATIKKRKFFSRDFKAFLLLQGPFLLWWVLLSVFPITFGLSLGFFKWKDLSRGPQWAGLENYIRFFTDAEYLRALWTSVWMGLLCWGLSTLFAFAFALVMLKLPKGQGVFRTLWYAPAVASIVAMTQIMVILVDPTYGMINRLLQNAGMKAINVRYDFFSSVFMIVFYTLWSGVGGGMLFWIAGCKSIDPQLYEASAIDGVNSWQKFIYITLPSLSPFFTYSIVTGVMNAIQIYAQVMFISGGDPLGRTRTLVYMIMTDSFENLEPGMAGASSMVMLWIVLLFSYFYLRRMTAVFKKDGGNG